MAMNLRFNKRRFRSSCVPPLLLFLLLFAYRAEAACRALSLPSDTIIIGGKYLIVEPRLEYDTLRASTTNEPVRPRKNSEWRAGFEAAPGVQFNRLRSTQEGYLLIDEFVGKNLSVEAAMAAWGFAEYRLGRSNLWLYAGAGINFFTVSGAGADLADLGDSVFVYRSPQTNVLEAIERFRYPIGTEFDTVSVSLSRRAIAFSSVQVPVQLGYTQALSRKLELMVYAGADVQFLRVTESRPLQLLSTSDDRFLSQELSPSDAFRSLSISPVIGARFGVHLDRKWMLLAGLRLTYAPSVFTADDVPFRHNAVRSSLTLGWSYTFD